MTEANAELIVERRDAAAIVTLNRPHSRNALNRAMRVGLVRLFAELDADPGVAAVVLTGADPAFSGGVDLKEALSSNHALPSAADQPRSGASRDGHTRDLCGQRSLCVRRAGGRAGLPRSSSPRIGPCSRTPTPGSG